MTANSALTMAEKPKSLAHKLALMQRDIGSLPKDKTNKTQGYDYTSADLIAQKVRELCATYNVAQSVQIKEYCLDQIPTSKGGTLNQVRIILEIILINADNPDDMLVNSVLGVATDSGDKAIWKAYTQLLKYFWRVILNLDTGDADSDTDTENTSSGDSLLTLARKKAIVPVSGFVEEGNSYAFQTAQGALKMNKDRAVSLVNRVGSEFNAKLYVYVHDSGKEYPAIDIEETLKLN